MIPKTIHYCWFGGKPLPELAQRCIASWKKYCPDYEIKEWNETNFDISSMDYMREAYEEKAWGFVPDIARLQIIYEQGGIYFDTDVEAVRSFDSLLENKAFMGLESGGIVALGLGFGAEKGHPLIKLLLDDYKGRHFRNPDGSLNRMAAPALQAPIFRKNGLSRKNKEQSVCGAAIYPTEYFCAKSCKTGVVAVTDRTYSIHHYVGSWLVDEERAFQAKRKRLRLKLGRMDILVWPFVWAASKTKQMGFAAMVRLAAEKIRSKLA